MKRAYSVSSYAKLYEKYCKENLPSEADGIFKRADEYYREFMRRDMPDLGKNMMAANMYDWFTIVSFYEASGHRLDGSSQDQTGRRRKDEISRKNSEWQQEQLAIQAI